MTHIDHYAPGSFCWIELGTSDQKAAKDFYGSLFGWSFDDMPMGPDDFYTMFKVDGQVAAAGYTLRAEERSNGVPPHWNLYIAVESADASAKRAAEAGGTVLAQPFDVYDAGRMAVIKDPTGAAFCLWEKKRTSGIQIAAVDGTLCWADLNTTDAPKAEKFYTALFGWEIAKDSDGTGYTTIQNGSEYIGGIPPLQNRNPNMPSHWLIYILVSNCDATADKAKKLGAKVWLSPRDIPGVGRMAVISDPQGAAFAIFQPAPRK